MTDVKSLIYNECKLWFRGDSSTSLIIKPSGVTVVPAGTFVTNLLKNGQRSILFDGSTSLVSLSKSTGFNNFTASSPFTIFLWLYVNLVSWTARDYGIFNISENNTNQNNRLIFEAYNGQIVGRCQESSNWDFSVSTYTLPVKQWVCLVLTNTGSVKSVYVNYLKYEVSSAAGGNVSDLGTGLEIGREVLGSSFYTPLMVKDFMIFKKVLTLTQIGQIMEETYIV
jgi:hypothetical protein